MRAALVIIIVLGFSSLCYSQEESNSTRRTPSSLDPGMEESRKDLQVRLRKNRKKGSVVETPEEYEARMKRTVKEIRKREKMLAKPQYSDPMYFGHKRPPKKRKAGHLKFCKECGMRH